MHIRSIQEKRLYRRRKLVQKELEEAYISFVHELIVEKSKFRGSGSQTRTIIPLLQTMHPNISIYKNHTELHQNLKHNFSLGPNQQNLKQAQASLKLTG